MPLSISDLPKSTQGSVIFDLDDGDTLTLEMVSNDRYYGTANSFDVEGSRQEIIDKLNRWGAAIVGWE